MWGFHIVLQTQQMGSLPTSEPPYLATNTPKWWQAPFLPVSPPGVLGGHSTWPKPSKRLPPAPVLARGSSFCSLALPSGCRAPRGGC